MKIHLYILRQLVVALIFAVGALLFIALPGIAVSTVHKMPNVDAAVLLQFLPLVLQSLAPYVLPLCFMLSTVAVFGRLAADKEWIAIHMAGIHPLRTLVTPLLVAVGLGLFTFWMVSSEVPQLKKRQKDFLVNATGSYIENLQPGKTSVRLGNFSLIASSRNSETGVFSDVYMRLPDEERDLFAKAVKIKLAEGGQFVDVRAADVTLFNPETGGSAQDSKYDIRINIRDRLEGNRKEPDFSRPKYLVSSEIRERLADGSIPEDKVREARYMLHYRLSMFAIYPLFLTLGAATGLLMRRGTQLGALAVAAGYGILYYVLNMRIGKELGQSSGLPPWVGAWLTTILGGGAGALLLRRAIRR